MDIYRVTTFEDDPDPVFEGTRAEGHKALKQHKGKPDARLELFNISVDKTSVLRMLNGEDIEFFGGPVKTWALTSRGGLLEVENGQ